MSTTRTQRQNEELETQTMAKSSNEEVSVTFFRCTHFANFIQQKERRERTELEGIYGIRH